MRLKLIITTALLALAGGNSYAQDRVIHLTPIGVIDKIQVSTRTTSDVVGAAKTIAPKDWKGFFKNGVDRASQSTVETRANELWTTALDRWLAQESLNASLNWKTKSIYFERSAEAQARAAAAVAPVAQPAPQPVAQDPVWAVKITDLRLENTLTRWTEQAGYKLLWDADRHILITAEDTFQGDFMTALNRILSSPAIRESDFPLEAVVYENSPPLIRITRLGEQNLNK